MSDHVKLVKAELRELKPNGDEVPDSRVPVQFNPESMKVSFANQVVPPNNGAATDARSTSAIQYVGKGTTKLSVQLWFDVTSVLPEGAGGVSDVRELTKKVAYFITPKAAEDDDTKQVPPGVRFLWGTFQFDGIMDALEESLAIAREAANATTESRAAELWQTIFGDTAEISKSLKGTSGVGSLLKPAAVASGGSLRFPPNPIEPKKPGGFG